MLKEVNRKKTIWAIPISTGWVGTNGVIISTGISAGFQVRDRVLIGPEMGLSINGTAYQNLHLGVFSRIYLNDEPNSFFAEFKYLHGVSRRNFAVNSGQSADPIKYDNLSRTYLGGGFKYINKKSKLREIFIGIKNDNKSNFLTIAEYEVGLRFYLNENRNN